MAKAKQIPTRDEILQWKRDQATISATHAGMAWGLGEVASYAAIARGDFPVEVIKIGRFLRVRTADVAEALGIEDDERAAV